MTDKYSFLEKLQTALTEREIPQKDIQPYLDRFDRFWDRMVSNPGTDSDTLLGQIDAIADNIAAQISSRYDDINRLAERTMNLSAVAAPADSTENVSPMLSDSTGKSVADNTDNYVADNTDNYAVDNTNKYAVDSIDKSVSVKNDTGVLQAVRKPSEAEKQTSARQSAHAEKTASPEIAAPKKQTSARRVNPDKEDVRDSDSRFAESAGESTRENDVMSQNTDNAPPDDFMNESFPGDEPVFDDGQQLPDYDEEETVQNSHTFWIIFGVTLPLTLVLAAVFFGFFAAVWILLAALILASIAALIGVAAVGTALSLVGIVYGISQLFLVMPIGLYEIGIGVICGSAAMFVGILLYNFAIRLIPFLMKLVGRLLVFLLKKFKKLFHYLKKECAKL